jgi:hypothetical protein
LDKLLGKKIIPLSHLTLKTFFYTTLLIMEVGILGR